MFVLALCLICSLLIFGDPFSSRAGVPDVGRRPPASSQSYVYSDGLEVRVTDVWKGRHLGVPVVELTVEVHNDSPHSFEAWLAGDLRYGTQRRLAVRYLMPPGPDDLGSVQLIALGASSDPYRLGFILSSDRCGDVVFTLGIDGGAHEPAVFAGSL